MRLVEFSVTNYRSITKAHKISIQDLTVLVGKNNEGKSNLLTALNVAMTVVIMHSTGRESRRYTYKDRIYDWKRDFPMQYQERKSGLESIFRLNFILEGEELSEFHAQTKIRGNENIPIQVKFGKDSKAKIEVPKQGSSSYSLKSKQITEFISKRISFNYIQAIRTEEMAVEALQQVIGTELYSLKENEEYVLAQNKVMQLRQEIFNRIADQLVEPLKVFLPNLQKVSIIGNSEEQGIRYIMRDFDIIIDDGLATSITNKGDGIKSLVAMAILKDRQNRNGASIIAIEEPESHLHSGAIHSLVDVINKMSQNNQVIITTHNPLFVQQNKLNANIIVDGGTARTAKTISEIRNILGVLPSDNLRNARYVVLVEGEDDKIALSKILPMYSQKIGTSLRTNTLIIKSMGGASNLSHDAADLKNSMCKFVALLDNDKAGKDAFSKAVSNGVIKEAEVRLTICNGSPESEFEDCLRTDVYIGAIKSEFGVNVSVSEFRGNKKWSERLKTTFLSQGMQWTDAIEKKVKLIVANAIPETFNSPNDVLITQKAGFLDGLVSIIESLIEEI
ncbi:MAG: AAA family ATPase [Clostridiales bacterium]|nr:AAA family ATPase [Clostridiales bacterium]